MATVITNLLSAIPVFGHDLVELIWGGLNLYPLDNNLINEEPYYSDIVLQILLIAGKRSLNEIRYCHSSCLPVKKLIFRTQSADIRYKSSIEFSQRIHAGNLTA